MKNRWTTPDREAALLRQADDHPNIIRYFSMESCDQFVYIALDLCAGNLDDLIQKKMDIKMDNVDILRQVLTGLNHLHGLQCTILHRDIKPSNILIFIPSTKDHPRAVISDLGCRKQLEAYETSFVNSRVGSGLNGTLGWMSPEMLNPEISRLTIKMDIFSFGLCVYYTLTSGNHPFGDVSFLRDANIMHGKSDLKHLDLKKDCLGVNLIEKMIAQCESERPTSSEALKHPFFWSKLQTKECLTTISDILESRDQHLLEAIEKISCDVFSKSWMDTLDAAVRDDLLSSSHRTYDGSKVRDLLRAVRNLSNHWRQLGPDVQASLGTPDEGFMDYWTSRFPQLVLHTYSSLMPYKSDPGLIKLYAL